MELSSFEQFAILDLLGTTDRIKKIKDVMEMFIKMFNKTKEIIWPEVHVQRFSALP